ncbi:diguanylate cyclase, partial [Salmonella enterica subsp. enterica]|nr:diguanylate cyclase [Salmonella enterica subsp. enterica]
MFEKLLVIRSRRKVIVLTIALTVLCVGAPVISLAALLGPMFFMPPQMYWGILGVAAAIPLLIAPPIAYIGLHILRQQTLTIEKVDEIVRYDGLTGVLSRAYFLGKTRDLLRNGGVFLMADADHFKSINDTYGHDVGDEALKRIA